VLLRAINSRKYTKKTIVKELFEPDIMTIIPTEHPNYRYISFLFYFLCVKYYFRQYGCKEYLLWQRKKYFKIFISNL